MVCKAFLALGVYVAGLAVVCCGGTLWHVLRAEGGLSCVWVLYVPSGF
jgi:hypothetical protein